MNKPAGATRAPKMPLKQAIPRAIAITAAIFLLLVCVAELKKVGVANAPVDWVYGSIVISAIALIVQMPQIFFRLPSAGKIAATAMLVAGIVVAQIEANLMDPIWMASPAGKKEAADIAARERARAEQTAKEEASDKAEKDAKAQQDLADKQAALDAQKPGLCNNLVSQVVDGEKVLEVNNVEVIPTAPDEQLTCAGDAITSRGSRRVEFGLIITPQGKDLISTRFR